MRGFGPDVVHVVGPTGIKCWISFAPVFSRMYFGVLILFTSRFVCTRKWYIDNLGIFHAKNIYVSWSITEIRVRLVPSDMLKPSSNFRTDHSKAVLVLWIMFVILFRVCFIVSVPCTLVVTWWESVGLFALVCVIFFCVFFTFPYGVLDQVWYFIVSIPGLCLLPYFDGYVGLH